MNDLLAMQVKFSHSLLENNCAVKQLLTETERPALAIYNHAYLVRFQETLKNDYPALAKLLGDDQFVKMADKYNSMHPSASYSLRNYGQYMAEFLSADELYKQQSYLAELAAFEWALNDVFDIADTPVANIDDMSSIPLEAWPVLSIKLHPSIRILELQWNINDIYSPLKQDNQIPDLIRHNDKKYYLIWRVSYSPHYRLIDTNELKAIKILENTNFSELCLALTDFHENPEDAPMQAATFLKSWLAAGLIESVN